MTIIFEPRDKKQKAKETSLAFLKTIAMVDHFLAEKRVVSKKTKKSTSKSRFCLPVFPQKSHNSYFKVFFRAKIETYSFRLIY